MKCKSNIQLPRVHKIFRWKRKNYDENLQDKHILAMRISRQKQSTEEYEGEHLNISNFLYLMFLTD